MDIFHWRKKIDALEDEIVVLLNQRASYAVEIGKIKQEQGIPVLDSSREEEILARVASKTKGPFSSDSIRAIFKAIMVETRKVED
ncbi:MAG TPA: chorismate mutase [Fibrobacter sp.]|nr:chorismate mutase [Fibrobacter sp.]